jgi:FkbM family methyltransferase
MLFRNRILQDGQMSISTERASTLVSAYSLARRSGFLNTSIGRQVFKSAYFLYKRYIEDDLQDLVESFPALVRGGDVLDIGANIGYTAAVLARVIEPDHKVYAFEPESFNFRILQQTAFEHEFKGRIIPMQYAVGAGNGTVDLWINDRHHADHRTMTEQFRSVHPESRGVSTTLVSVDSFLKSSPGAISFVKIDVQGYELAVCQGMQETLRQNPEITIVLEFMPSAMRELGIEPSHLIDFFVERGFGIYLVHSRGKLSKGMPTIPNDSSYFDLLFTRRPVRV